MIIDIFDKDLDDDINVKALKNRIYKDVEIWNLIYFSIFVFSIFEEHSIPIDPILRKNFLIHKKKFKYFHHFLYSTEPWEIPKE